MKSWSFTVAQGGYRRVKVEGIGSGIYIPSPQGSRIEEADPAGCEAELLAWLRDEQEALSIRYGAGTILVVPLRSGRFASFGPDRQLITIGPPPTAEELRLWSREGYEKVQKAKEALQATAEELGL